MHLLLDLWQNRKVDWVVVGCVRLDNALWMAMGRCWMLLEDKVKAIILSFWLHCSLGLWKNNSAWIRRQLRVSRVLWAQLSAQRHVLTEIYIELFSHNFLYGLLVLSVIFSSTYLIIKVLDLFAIWDSTNIWNNWTLVDRALCRIHETWLPSVKGRQLVRSSMYSILSLREHLEHRFR